MMERTMTPIAEAFGCHILTFCVGKPGALIIAPEQQRATGEIAQHTHHPNTDSFADHFHINKTKRNAHDEHIFGAHSHFECPSKR